MVTQTRNVTKSLAGMEDLQQLRGPHTQTRSGEAVTVHGIDVPYAVGTVADMQALDVARFQYARVYSSAASYTDYFYDAESTLGESSDTGIGSWLTYVGGSTAQRPATPSVYQSFFDSTLGYAVWWNGVDWVDSTGATV